MHDWYASPHFIRDDQIKEDKEGEEDNIYVEEEKCLQGWCGNMKGRDHLENLGKDDKILQ